MFFWIPKPRPSPRGTQDQGGEEAYRGLKFPRCVGLWEEILSPNRKQRRFGMRLNRVNFFGKIQRRGHNLKEIVKSKAQKMQWGREQKDFLQHSPKCPVRG